MDDLRDRIRKREVKRPSGFGIPHRVWTALGIFLGALVAFLIMNDLVMPRFVRHGSEVEVPRVTGLSLADAVARLRGAGLAVRDTVERTSVNVPRGSVIDQNPRAKLNVKPERGILLVVSQGKVEQKIPDLSGQTLRFARLALGRDGYDLGEVIRVPSTREPRNTVMASDPPRGDVLSTGESVSLLVSDGPQRAEWVMPDLTGKDIEETADRLNDAGFVAVVDDQGGGGWFFQRRDRVHRTDPAPGVQVAEGDTIRLYNW
jgi:beta-lactam-binding protein with PASTA domain